MTIARKHDTVAGQCPRQSAGLSRFVIWHFKLRHYPHFSMGICCRHTTKPTAMQQSVICNP